MEVSAAALAPWEAGGPISGLGQSAFPRRLGYRCLRFALCRRQLQSSCPQAYCLGTSCTSGERLVIPVYSIFSSHLWLDRMKDLYPFTSH